jgi:hypothetical protein
VGRRPDCDGHWGAPYDVSWRYQHDSGIVGGKEVAVGVKCRFINGIWVVPGAVGAANRSQRRGPVSYRGIDKAVGDYKRA